MLFLQNKPNFRAGIIGAKSYMKGDYEEIHALKAAGKQSQIAGLRPEIRNSNTEILNNGFIRTQVEKTKPILRKGKSNKVKVKISVNLRSSAVNRNASFG